MREKLNQESQQALERVVQCLGQKKEERQEQVQMTQFLRRFLEFAETPGHVAMVEAGTGIGKSFAYLTALCEYLQAHGSEKVVIATNTLTLMDQLLFKDLPVLQKIYPKMVFASAKGHHNYLCLYKFYRTLDTLFSEVPEQEKAVLEAALIDSDGERSSLPDVSEGLWQQIRCESVDCLGQDCIYSNQCYFNRSRWKWKDAQVIVTNHALALVDLLQQPIFPEYHDILFDEAHNLEHNAINSLTVAITLHRIREIYQLADTPQCEEAFLFSQKSKAFFQWKQKLLALAALFFHALGPDERDQEVKPYLEGWDLLYHMESFQSDIRQVQEQAVKNGADFSETSITNFYNDLQQVHDDLKVWLEHGLDMTVYWHENNGCFYAPIDLSAQLQRVWENKNVVFVSATLTIGGTFEHLRRQLGLPEQTTYALKLESPFPYQENALVYHPRQAPSPRWEPMAYTGFVADTVEQLLRVTQGHTFVLFTSYKMLQEVYEAVVSRLEDMPLTWLIQGRDRKEKLLEQYRQASHPVLMGTDSYWEGVDEEMDCLVIAKLPFSVPTTPLEQARSELIQSRNGNPFLLLSLPKCALKLKQGAGRLIRRQDKRGVIVLCDPRIRQAEWGRTIQKSLPPMRWTDQFEVCQAFLEELQRQSEPMVSAEDKL